MAFLDCVVLHKAICRLEGNLGQSAKSVEDVENITLRHFIAREIPYGKERKITLARMHHIN